MDTKSCFSMALENVSQNVFIIFESSGHDASYSVKDSPQSPSIGWIGDSIRFILKLKLPATDFRFMPFPVETPNAIFLPREIQSDYLVLFPLHEISTRCVRRVPMSDREENPFRVPRRRESLARQYPVAGTVSVAWKVNREKLKS